MKHNVKITIILLTMFVITQFIGLAVINSYSPKQEFVLNETTGQLEEITKTPELPFNMSPPDVEPASGFSSILFAFIIAIVLIFTLMKFKIKIILRTWFFVVVLIALAITFSSFFLNSSLYEKFISINSYQLMRFSTLIALLVALPLAFIKIYRRNLLIHNLTELLIYPGIAVIFVFLFAQWGNLGVAFMIFLLILISIYDIWAVWHSGVMQKMAKFQMNEVKVFAGFFVPYFSKKIKQKIKKMKKSKLKHAKIKVNIAILGGGDVVFPIITSGVFLINFGFLHALFVIFGATFGLAYLFFLAKKRKFYPAMPFITGGIFLGIAVSFLISSFL